MIAYLRLFPKTLIAGWTSGTGVSGCISGFLNLLTQLIGTLPLDILYLVLAPVGPIYFGLFYWTYKLLKNADTGDMPTDKLIRESTEGSVKNENEAINTDENVAINDENQNTTQNESMSVDEINKLNQTMSCSNFGVLMQQI